MGGTLASALIGPGGVLAPAAASSSCGLAQLFQPVGYGSFAVICASFEDGESARRPDVASTRELRAILSE
jgi:hypothetical protein